MARTFDVIVVGGGSAGCALAAGLAAQPDTSVLLLEAGPRPRDPRVRIPAAASDLWFGALDWAFDCEPQAALDGRRDTWPRGRALGGSTVINAMMWVRGMDVDYDAWPALGAPGWDAASMTASFRRLEDDARGPAPHRGIGGPIPVAHQQEPRELTHAFLDACEEVGIPRVDDYHASPDGCGLTMVTQRDGARWTAADAFLRDHLRDRGSSLTVRAGVEVERVAFEDGRAIGVDVLVDGRRRFARASREVVLSAGAIGSPVVLQRSGIGPADDLRALGIEVVAHLPGVGENLQDHLATGLSVGTDGGGLFGADRDPRAMLRWLRRREGPLTSNLAEAIAFLRTEDGLEAPDIELLFVPAALEDHGRTRHAQHGLTLVTILLRPESRGRIRLASADPTTAPRIDPGSLSDPTGQDLRRLTAGLAAAQRLVTDTAALGARVTNWFLPAAPLRDDAALAAHTQATGQTFYHPVGTCRIGTDDLAVVDPQLRVHGVEGLRVADASVMPTLVRGHTAAPALAMGERAARIIAGTDPAVVGAGDER
jgi:choline dehydrogenase